MSIEPNAAVTSPPIPFFAISMPIKRRLPIILDLFKLGKTFVVLALCVGMHPAFAALDAVVKGRLEADLRCHLGV